MDNTKDTSKNFRDPKRWNSVVVPEHVAQRAITNMDKQADGCWISKYSVMSTGYAQIGWWVKEADLRPGRRGRNEMVLAHRAAWVAVNGQVPLGMTIDHLCKVRRCVNPEHMRLLPNYENARRTSGRDWPLGFCVNGHDATHLIEVTRSANAKGTATVCGICLQDSRGKWEMNNPDKVRESRARYAAKSAARKRVRKRAPAGGSVPTAAKSDRKSTRDKNIWEEW